jgi:ribonucleoside-diphosphate reductase alpha chain
MGSNFLPTDYQSFIHKSRYAKYFDGYGRESWDDTVARYSTNVIADKVDPETRFEIEKSFDEAMYILLCGTGVGFSVERQYISKLPEVPVLYDSDTTVVVKDSKEGWAKAFRQVLALLWAGEIPKWDVSKVRPAGARLKTFGGRASGPAPLVELFNFAVSTFKNAQGRKLSSIECHDLMCFIGQIVVVGGVRLH